MKRCPACQRRYRDDALNFCRDDGTPLVVESSSEGEPETNLFDSEQAGTEAATQVFRASGNVSGRTVTSSSLTSPLQRRRSTRRAIDSLAVLPLVNASTDPEMEYFSYY